MRQLKIFTIIIIGLAFHQAFFAMTSSQTNARGFAIKQLPPRMGPAKPLPTPPGKKTLAAPAPKTKQQASQGKAPKQSASQPETQKSGTFLPKLATTTQEKELDALIIEFADIKAIKAEPLSLAIQSLTKYVAALQQIRKKLPNALSQNDINNLQVMINAARNIKDSAGANLKGPSPAKVKKFASDLSVLANDIYENYSGKRL